MLFALLVIFNNYAMDKIDSGEVNNSMEYFGYILHCYCCIWLCFWAYFALVLWMKIFMNITPIGYRCFQLPIWCLDKKYCEFTTVQLPRPYSRSHVPNSFQDVIH